MFPKEIAEILEKYQDTNIDELISLNKYTNGIIEQLKSFCVHLSDQMTDLMNNYSMDTKVKEQELLEDSQILRSYINSIQPLNIHVTPNDDNNTKYDIPEFDEYTHVHITCEDLCPKCQTKLNSTTIYYKRKNNDMINRESVSGYRCSKDGCGSLYMIDVDAKGFDFNNTNIKIHTQRYNKLCVNDAIVVSNINKCSKHNHNIEDVVCNLPIIKPGGDVSYKNITLIHCFSCNKYTMLKSDYDSLDGVPGCIVINETSNTGSYTENDFYYGDQSGSKLYQHGYNVNSVDNLTVEQRQTILSTLLLSKTMTKGEIGSILDTNINRGTNGNRTKDWSKAVAKWKEDKEYVNNIDLKEESNKVNINRLILRFTVPGQSQI